MAINNFKPFALDPNANVTSQADWEALPALLSGFTAGKASSAQVNKAIRQASFIAAALAQYTANKSGLDVLDDGDLNGFISKMGTAFGKDFQALDATLSALAGLATGANKLPYFTGNDTAAQTDLTSVGRDIIGKNTIADILTYLGLGDLVDALIKTNNLSDLPDKALSRGNLGVYSKAEIDARIGYSLISVTAVTVSTRAVLTNPFGINTPVMTEAELLFSDGNYYNPGFVYTTSGTGVGIKSGAVAGEGIVFVSGSILASNSPFDGGGMQKSGLTIASPAKARIKVWEVK